MRITNESAGGGGATDHSDLGNIGTGDHHTKYTDAEAVAATAKDYAAYHLTTGGLTGITNTVVTLTVNAVGIESDGAVFDLTTSIVTVSKTAVFKIEADMYINSSANARSEYTTWLEQNTGGGYTEIPGTRAANYARGYDSGDTSSITTIVAVTSGDLFRLRCQRTDGGGTSGYQDNNGTRLVFTEMG